MLVINNLWKCVGVLVRRFYLIVILLYGCVLSYADSEMLVPRHDLTPEQVTEEVQLARFNDFLSASIDSDARKRAADYYDVDISKLYYMTSQPRLVGHTYLRIRDWENTPENYWLERGLTVPAGDANQYELLIGQGLLKEARENAELLKSLAVLELRERELQQCLTNVEVNIKSLYLHIGCPILLVCISIIFISIFSLRLSDLIKKKKN